MNTTLTSSAGTKTMDSKFYSELKQLNEDLIKFLQQSQDKSAYMDFTPTLQDYIKQFSALEKQFPPTTTGPPQQPAPMSLFGATTTNTTTLTTTTSTALPPFSQTLASLPTSNAAFSMPTTTQPFLFGAPPAPFSSTTGSSATGPSPFFSFVASAGLDKANKDDAPDDATGADDEEAHQPPEPVIDKYEEPNAKHSVKCKLYERVKGGDLNLLGIGTLYVKTMEASSGLQVIVRQDPDLRRVLLNEVVIPTIPVKLLPKAVQMVFPNAAGDSKFYIAKLKDEAEAQVLFETLKQV